jgi:hypothetical protein
MKKFCLSLTAVIVTCFSLKAQPPIQWQKSYGSTPHQTIDGNVTGNFLLQRRMLNITSKFSMYLERKFIQHY